jgi:sulfhydrogenase subunit beta (sulfur reductase)
LEKFERTLDTKGLPEILNSLYENDIWEDISRICLGCNICTYSCPVCHCFDIQDECDGLQGCRVRIWDCCSNPEYTLHASGHNPRSTRVQRVRNKILHKFSFLPKNVDMFGCVGCGRCIELCPENWDILDAIERVRKVKSK